MLGVLQQLVQLAAVVLVLRLQGVGKQQDLLLLYLVVYVTVHVRLVDMELTQLVQTTV
jgi:hypothetical protein